MYLFREYVKYRLMEADIPPMPPGLSPEEQQLWTNDSWRKFWIMQHPDYLKAQQPQIAPKAVARALAPNQAQQQILQREWQKVQMAINIIQSGFETGGNVSSSIRNILKLDNENRSLVGDSEQFAVGGAHPFYKDKFGGRFSGNIRYKKGYPINVFLDKIKNLLEERFKTKLGG